MKIIFFETQPYEREFFAKALAAEKPIFVPLEAEEYLETLKEKKDLEEVRALSTFIYSNIDEEVLKHFPALRLIASRSTGLDHIDLGACARRKVKVLNVSEYGTNTVAEHTWALILSLMHKITESVARVKLQGSFSLENLRGSDVFGKTLGIVGCGKIGSRVGELGRAFGCHILAYDPARDSKSLAENGFLKAELKTLYEKSDLVTFHAPLCKETTHLLSRESVQHLKKGVFIINTARGGLIETKALLDGLGCGIIAGVALDVLEEEEDIKEELELLNREGASRKELEIMVQNHLLMKDPRVLITPHNAFNTEEALQRIMEKTVENIRSFQLSS